MGIHCSRGRAKSMLGRGVRELGRTIANGRGEPPWRRPLIRGGREGQPRVCPFSRAHRGHQRRGHDSGRSASEPKPGRRAFPHVASRRNDSNAGARRRLNKVQIHWPGERSEIRRLFNPRQRISRCECPLMAESSRRLTVNMQARA